MSVWIWILVLLIFGFVAFAQPDEVAQGPAARVTIASEGWKPVTVGDVEGVIVTADDAPLLVSSLGLELDEDAYWRPARTQIESAEAALAEEEGVLDHMRQYAGYREVGDRKIFINGFCDTAGIDWRERPVIVDDGGDCFFTAIYNVDRDELERFRFNGEA